MKLFAKFERNRAIRGGVIAISMFDLMTLNIALRVALGSGIIFTKCDLDLSPVDLKRSWYIKGHVIKVCTKFERNRIIYRAELLTI